MRLTQGETMLANLPSFRRYDIVEKLAAAPSSIAEMTVEQRREYDRRKRAESRARHKAAAAAGAPMPSQDVIRDALADAALMPLAVDGPGAEQIGTSSARSSPPGPAWSSRSRQMRAAAS